MSKLSAWKEEWKQGLEQAWGSVSEGWHELSDRAAGALTRFRPSKSNSNASDEDRRTGPPVPSAGWSFMAADVFDDSDQVVVRLEAPGMRREDFQIELDGDVLIVRGEKQFHQESAQGRYRVVQCAYGSFQRAISLPSKVHALKTVATYRDGVLRVVLPKAQTTQIHHIEVQGG